MEDLTIKVDGKEYNVKVEETEDGRILVHCNGDVYEIQTTGSKETSIFNRTKKKSIEETGKCAVTAPLPGTIYEVRVKPNDIVKEGDLLIKLVAMKMENDIIAPKGGIIKEVNVKKNDNVNKDDILLIIE
ncbi:biotin/lipoyl-binding protein [Candidatus Woesearchaeota archaeon]|nr:biotin/lipoyl-binding protein [Candidatus Woesearchaeota archaeon]